MASESDSKKLNDLRVVDLRSELEKRDLDKTGVKAVLIERLQKVLEEEGQDPETYVFDLSDSKKTPTRGKKSDNEEDEEKTEEDKTDVDEENQSPKKTTNKPTNDSVDNKDTNKAVDGVELDKSDGVVNSNEMTKETNSLEDSKHENITECKQEKVDSEKDINDLDKPKTNEKKEGNKETESMESNKDSSSVKTPSTKEADPKSTDSSGPPTKEDKISTEANGINDNEDSINLTIGEDEEKLVADEDDISQEKDQKDDSHGTSGQKKASTGAKNQDKSNQEKTDGRSSAALDKSAKDEKNKKLSSAASASKNLWVSGLATTTRATDLKQVFSKFGKVIGAKVVTNARTPGARCYGYVTMSSADDANKAVAQLHHTELHGRLISVEKAKGDSTGPPKRVAEPPKTSQPVKKVEEKKQDSTVRKVDSKKEDIVPPGTEGEVTKEPAAPGTEDVGAKKEENGGRRGREPIRAERHSQGEKRPHSQSSGHRNTSRGGSPVLTFEKIKEERERQRLREKERLLREEERRREIERIRQKEIDRKQREEFEILERERRKLKMEKERVMREKEELMKLRAERQRLERERQKLEREKLEKEKEELERLKRQNMRLEEEARRKRSLSASREREYERSKRPAPDSRYMHSSSSSQRFEPPSRSSDYKKDVHKVSAVPRRPGFDPPESSRRMVTSLSSSARGGWQSKDRDSSRYERTSVNSSSFREDSRSKPTESRHVRERYADGSKGERFVERASGSTSWSSGGGGVGAQVKSFSGSRDTWASGSSDRKVDHMPEPWSRPSTNTNRWASNSGSIGISSRPQSGIAGPMFSTSSISIPSMGLSGMSNLSPFSSGDRFDAYKQPYFKGP